jgi:hypothetical protein
MDARSFARWAAGIGLGAASLLTAIPSAAEEIRISRGDCASGVHLVARDAHLSEILAQLAKALDFKLSFESDSDPVVSIDAIRQPPDLVARLAALENVSMTQARSPRCPDRQRIVKVWILPRGAANPAREPVASAPTPDLGEQARRTRAGTDMILRAHGIPPSQAGSANSR